MREHYDFEDGSRNPYAIQFVKTEEGFIVASPNGKKVGELLVVEDGEWVFWPTGQGAWNHYMLSSIANKLEELNAT